MQANSYQKMSINDQIRVSVEKLKETKSNVINIQLHPAELGKLKITMEVGTEGVSSVKFLVENKDTLELLQKDIKIIEKTIENAGAGSSGTSLSFNLSNSNMADSGAGKQNNFSNEDNGKRFFLDSDFESARGIEVQSKATNYSILNNLVDINV